MHVTALSSLLTIQIYSIYSYRIHYASLPLFENLKTFSKLLFTRITKPNIPILQFSTGHFISTHDGNQYGSKYPQATFPQALPDYHCKRVFTPGFHLKTVIQSARPATCLDHLNGMLIGLKKVSALAGDKSKNLIIYEGTFIDRFRLIGGIICL